MRHFATESGKSKGQFYIPAEVSGIMAQIIGIKQAKTSPRPLSTIQMRRRLIASESGRRGGAQVMLYRQEKDAAEPAPGIRPRAPRLHHRHLVNHALGLIAILNGGRLVFDLGARAIASGVMDSACT
jgi:hypothetical protein